MIDNPKDMQHYYCLALDTSTSAMTVAILDHGKLIGEIHSQAERNHSIGLLPHIQELLASVGLKPKDLNSVAVGRGPGSYTGVRISVSVAKTFAWSLGLTLLGVSSLEAMALGGSRAAWKAAPGQGAEAAPVTWVVPLMDARRTQAFTAVYAVAQGAAGEEDGAGLVEVLPDGIRLMSAWVEQLLACAEEAERRPERLVFVGETAGFAEQIEACKERWPGEVLSLDYQIEAEYVGKLAYPRLAQGEADEVHAFVPNYTQLTEAEVNLLAKAQKGDH